MGSHVYPKEFEDLYNGPAIGRIEFSEGVQSVSPHRFDILRVCKFIWCPIHKDKGEKRFSHVAVCNSRTDYTDLIGPGMYLHPENRIGIIIGNINDWSVQAFLAEIGHAVESRQCGCTLHRISDEEAKELLGKDWTCRYASGHLVDER